MKQILMIDDDADLAAPLQKYFGRHALSLSHAAHPDVGLQKLRDESFDLLILDIMLPDKDGFEVCKEVRAFSQIPIIMLTARGEVTDRIVGLELGADDYLPKPFDPRELVARISRVLKRGAGNSQAVASSVEYYDFGDLQVDIARQQATLEGQVLALTGHEFVLLKQFCLSNGAVISRDGIMNEVNGVQADVFSRSVDVLVSRLRNKLKPLQPIVTLRGKGYQWVLRPQSD